ncbi:GNAT family N-acetyltransferase [Candidatus Neomarinimicrobiota bacterium]
MKIRLATLNDLNPITTIYNQAIASRRSTGQLTPVNIHQRMEWFQNHDPDSIPIFVADVGGKVHGYAYLTYYRGGREAFSRTREISYFIDSSYRHQGLASQLYNHVVSFCKKHGIQHLLTYVLANNKPSIKFLEKNGFSLWGNLPHIANIDDHEINHVIYGIRLQPILR